MVYATTTDVSNELNGMTIDGSSVPSATTVETWIAQESELLNKETGKLWGSTTITDEYHDYDGSSHLLTDYSPIISVTSVAYEANGINADTENWITLTEGRTSANSFIVYKAEGDLEFHGTVKPTAGYQNFKITYEAGYETVNPVVTLIIAKKVALRVMSTVINGQSGEEGGNVTVGAISISDPSTFSLDRMSGFKTEINDLTNSLGSFKTYRYNRRWD